MILSGRVVGASLGVKDPVGWRRFRLNGIQNFSCMCLPVAVDKVNAAVAKRRSEDTIKSHEADVDNSGESPVHSVRFTWLRGYYRETA